MDKRECFVIYTLKLGEKTSQIKQVTLVLDIDDSIEDQLRQRYPNLVDWKWNLL